MEYFVWEKLYASFSVSLRKSLEKCDALLTLSYSLQVALDRGMEGRLVRLNFSAAFDRISHCDLLYKLMWICFGGQFLSIVSGLIGPRKQCVRLAGKVSASVYVVSGVLQGRFLGQMLFILYTSELSHVVGNHIVGYAEDTKICEIIPMPL